MMVPSSEERQGAGIWSQGNRTWEYLSYLYRDGCTARYPRPNMHGIRFDTSHVQRMQPTVGVSCNPGLHLGLLHDSCGQALGRNIFRVVGMHILAISVVRPGFGREEAKAQPSSRCGLCVLELHQQRHPHPYRTDNSSQRQEHWVFTQISWWQRLQSETYANVSFLVHFRN